MQFTTQIVKLYHTKVDFVNFPIFFMLNFWQILIILIKVWSMADLLQDDGSAYTQVYPDFDFHNDVVLLPYSSGTTGLPKAGLNILQ